MVRVRTSSVSRVVGGLVIIFLACNRDLGSERQSTAVEVKGGPAITMQGSLTWGHEVRAFVECGSTAESWVADGTGGEVRRVYESLATEPYEKVFFEIRGERGEVPETAFGADYAGSVTVTEVRRAESGSGGCPPGDDLDQR